MVDVIAAIPSPSFNTIGPFNIYGMLIAIGAFSAIWLGQKRWAERGNDPEDISAIALWAIPAGVIGARAYHVLTDWPTRFSGQPISNVFKIWEGGLGIPGGMAAGIIAGLLVAKSRGIDVKGVLDAVVPGLPLAQAIGRWGNWFNQEVFGRPTDLPWGLEIDANHRGSIPAEFASVEEFPTFHPTFLYEGIWNIGLVGVILWVDRKGWLPKGRLIATYLIGYGIGRLWIETVRIDTATEILGLRVNIWMSIALIIGGLITVAWPRGGAATQDAVAEDTVDLDLDESDDETEPTADTVSK